MTVFVLNKGYDYEGEQTLGVFSTYRNAREAVVDYGREYGFEVIDYPFPIDSDKWECGSTTFYIREMEIDK